MDYAGPAGNKPKHLCPNTGLEIWKFSNWANPKDINGTEMNEFGPKNNAPGLENECRQIQSNSHVYICINEQVGF